MLDSHPGITVKCFFSFDVADFSRRAGNNLNETITTNHLCSDTNASLPWRTPPADCAGGDAR